MLLLWCTTSTKAHLGPRGVMATHLEGGVGDAFVEVQAGGGDVYGDGPFLGALWLPRWFSLGLHPLHPLHRGCSGRPGVLGGATENRGD